MSKLKLPDRHLSPMEWAILWLLDEGWSATLLSIGPQLSRMFSDLPDAALIPAVADALEGLWKLGLVRFERWREGPGSGMVEVPTEEVMVVLAKYEAVWSEWASFNWDSFTSLRAELFADLHGEDIVLTEIGRRTLQTQVRLPPGVR